MAEPITILIKKGKASDTLSGGTGTPETPSMSDTADSSADNVSVGQTSKTNPIFNQAVGLALVDAGKQMAMNAVAQYGNFTGNTVAQNKINTGIQVAGMLLAIKASPILGTIATVTQLSINAMNNSLETAKANLQTELSFERTGNAALNGGRGTKD